jgi:hypothetical protein
MITGPLSRSQHKEEEEEKSISLGRPAGGGLGHEQQMGGGGNLGHENGGRAATASSKSVSEYIADYLLSYLLSGDYLLFILIVRNAPLGGVSFRLGCGGGYMYSAQRNNEEIRGAKKKLGSFFLGHVGFHVFGGNLYQEFLPQHVLKKNGNQFIPRISSLLC